MIISDKIRSQARMNVDEIQSVLDAAKSGTVSISGLLVIRDDISKMIRLYADQRQHEERQNKIFAYEKQVNNVVTELNAINEIIVSIISDVSNIDNDIIIKTLKRIKKTMIQLSDTNK